MPTTRTRKRLLALTLAAAAAVVGGGLSACVSRSAADGDRTLVHDPVRLPPSAWPARLTDDLDQVVRDTPAAIPLLVPDGTCPESEIDEGVRWRMRRGRGAVVNKGRYGEGIIRMVRQPRTRWELRFVSFSPVVDRPKDARLPKFAERIRKTAADYIEQHKPKGVKLVDDDALAVLLEGTAMRLDEPDGKPVGLVIHMAGLGSITYEQPMLDELKRRGWAVLRITTPSVWWYEAKPWTIKTEADIEPMGKNLARVIDDLVAEPAYAAEAALQYLAKERPDIPQSPLVMVGCSAGALAAPVVIARMPDRFTAAVLVGGGANLFKLSQTSDLTDGGVRIIWAEGVGNASHRQQLYDAYLKHSKLDPYHTARTMLDKPVLVVQAAFDSTVSASGGDLLWQRLGRPERWLFGGGHRLLFWRLEDYAVPIANWIDEHADTTAVARAAATAPAPSARP